MSAMEQDHATEIAALKKKREVSPNSWLEIMVTAKGRKRRTYVRRQHASFKDAMPEYAKDVSKDIYSMQVESNGTRIGISEAKMMEQLGIKDGDEIHMQISMKLDSIRDDGLEL